MLRVWWTSGEELAALPVEQLSTVRALKQDLHKLCGVPRFRQRLIHDDKSLSDSACLDAAIDVQLLLQPFALPSTEETRSLCLALNSGCEEAVDAILQKPMDPDVSLGDRGARALHLACQAGHTNIVRLLVEASASLDPVWNFSTPLDIAVSANHMEVATYLLQEGAASHEGLTDLLCKTASAEVARLLLKHGANKNKVHCVAVSVTAGDEEVTPLGFAIRAHRTEVARVLIDAGAIGLGLRTPLRTACAKGDLETVRLITEVNPSMVQEGHAISAACASGQVGVLRLLLEARADKNMVCDRKGTALHVACSCNQPAIVQALLNAGADKDRVAGDPGATPLCVAACRSFTEIASLLLEAGADQSLVSVSFDSNFGLAVP